MWSEKYQIFHEIMKDIQSEFEMHPIHIPQSRFDDELYKQAGEYFWYGSLIKVETVIDSIVESMANSTQYLLFTDIDIIVKPGVNDALKPYIDANNDMVFLKEGSHTNIGFILLKATDNVLNFWKMIRSMMIEKTGLDQTYVNQMLESYLGKWTHFDNQVFACSNTWNGTILSGQTQGIDF